MTHRILVDQGSFFGEEFAELCGIGSVEVRRKEIEAHSSLNLGERYYQPLLTVYCELRSEHPAADKHLTLALTVKVMNDTLGLNGVVPSTLIFGEHPPVFTCFQNRYKLSTLDNRAKIAFEARKKMEQHMAKFRINRALRHAVPPAADVTYAQND